MKQVFYILLVLTFLSGCQKPEKYPEIPAITFVSFDLKDTVDLLDNPIKQGILRFSVVDGNGDIGLKSSDTTNPYHKEGDNFYNLVLELHEFKNGVYTNLFDSTKRYRVSYVEPIGQNKTLKCTILVAIDFEYDVYNQLKYDTVKYNFYLVDRALNKSNLESTGMKVLDN